MTSRTAIPTVLEQIEADLREAMSTTGTGMYVTAYPEQLAQLVEVAKAAQAIVRGVDEPESMDEIEWHEAWVWLRTALAQLAPADNTEET